jgi:hypothetical protein
MEDRGQSYAVSYHSPYCLTWAFPGSQPSLFFLFHTFMMALPPSSMLVVAGYHKQVVVSWLKLLGYTWIPTASFIKQSMLLVVLANTFTLLTLWHYI